MRIAYFSDLHLELLHSQTRRKTEWESHVEETRQTDGEAIDRGEGWVDYAAGLGPDLRLLTGVDAVVLAGDIGRAIERRDSFGRPAWPSSLDYAESIHRWLGCPVILVPGNHEHYRGEFCESRATLLAGRPGVQVLDRHAVVIGDVRILGATAWTDYALHGNPARGMAASESGLNDHRAIQVRRKDGTRDRWRAHDALSEHQAFRSWLADELARPHDGPSVVVTHHVPHPAGRNPGYASDELEPAFISDLTDLLRMARAAGVRAWIFGHNHWCVDTEVEGVRLLSAQRGYQGETTGWTGPGVLEVGS